MNTELRMTATEVLILQEHGNKRLRELALRYERSLFRSITPVLLIEVYGDAILRDTMAQLQVLREETEMKFDRMLQQLRSATAVAALVTLAGCGTTWTKPGATAAQYRSDHYACERDGAGLPPVRAIGLLERCMQAKGWSAT